MTHCQNIKPTCFVKVDEKKLICEKPAYPPPTADIDTKVGSRVASQQAEEKRTGRINEYEEPVPCDRKVYVMREKHGCADSYVRFTENLP